jgi:predicted anti-sigma-YlaC factor YlaD
MVVMFHRFGKYSAALGVALVVGLWNASCASNPSVAGFFLPRMAENDAQKLQKYPDDAALRLETGSYYIMYANAFVQGPASLLPPDDYETRDNENERAKAYYLKGAAILNDGLEQKYPGITTTKASKLARYCKRLTRDDVPWIYWMVAGYLSAYSLDPLGQMALGLKLPAFDALIHQAYKLDPDFNDGALDDFFIIYYGSLPPGIVQGMTPEKKKTETLRHYWLSIAKSKGAAASPFVSYADAVAKPAQDYAAFRANLEMALAVDNSRCPSSTAKLANVLAQRKAQYMLDHTDLYIASNGANETNEINGTDSE